MKAPIRYLLLFFFSAVGSNAVAQSAEMADTFRSEGKIYVVVAIILIVLAGLILYLFLMDRKMNKLERMIQEKKQTKERDKSF